MRDGQFLLLLHLRMLLLMTSGVFPFEEGLTAVQLATHWILELLLRVPAAHDRPATLTASGPGLKLVDEVGRSCSRPLRLRRCLTVFRLHLKILLHDLDIQLLCLRQRGSLCLVQQVVVHAYVLVALALRQPSLFAVGCLSLAQPLIWSRICYDPYSLVFPAGWAACCGPCSHLPSCCGQTLR